MITSTSASASQDHSKTAGAATQTAFTGFLVRDYFGDSGSIPTSGPVYQSPDIIPYQNNTLSAGTASSTYNGSDIGMNVISGAANNIYVRSMNLGASAQSGYATLYYSLASLLMQPTAWVNNQVATAGGSTTAAFDDTTTNSTSVGAGDIALTSPSFLLTSLQAPGAGQHYCFVAIGSTNAAPFTPPTTNFGSNNSFATWVQNNPNVAWRNFGYFASSQQNIVQTLQFGNASTQSRSVILGVSATNCPTGTAVQFVSTSQTCPFNFTIYLPQPNDQGTQSTSYQVTVPGDYYGTLTFTATPPQGGSFQSNSTLHASAIPLVDEPNMDEKHLRAARKFTTHLTKEDGSVEETELVGILVGEYNWVTS